VSGRDI